jgi:hypothetical protein
LVSEGEREVMALMLTTNAEMVAGVLRRTQGPQTQSVTAAIAATRALNTLVDDTLHALVREARSEGRTWAEIGELLHVTRQAAFQRFGGKEAETTDGEAAMPTAEACTEAVRVLKLCLEEQWDEVRATFDARMNEAVPVELLKAAVANVRSLVGPFVAMGTGKCEIIGDYTVADVLVTFEKGEIKGQVAFNVDREVAGLFLLPVDSASGTET